MTVVDKDPTKQVIRLKIPGPKVTRARLDHSPGKTKENVDPGLLIGIGHPAIVKMREDALSWGQEQVKSASEKPEPVTLAKRAAEEALRLFYQMAGWDVVVEWDEK